MSVFAALVVLFNLKKLNFDLLTPTPGSGVGVWSWVGVREQNICDHASAFVIPFILTCNMILF